MCGIAGVVRFDSEPVRLEQLKDMTDSLVHRGPDGEGQWVCDKGNIGLGHRRLSILDLSENGAQPMHFAGGRYSISFNGEVYNYIELRNVLRGKGYVFQSDSDTEVLLAIYHEKRETMLDDLDGMFAFAIWDNLEQTIFCARDRFGEKPFFYAYDSNRFIFASEMKALWAYGVPKIIDEDKRKLYVDRAVIRTPETVTESFYQGISILDASHYILLDSKTSELLCKKYWSLDGIEIDRSITLKDATFKFRELLIESIERRLRSDVAIGSSLSGGLDSSSIVTLIDQLETGGYSQQTFSARFENFSKDEGEYIAMVAKSCPSIVLHDTYPERVGLLPLLEKASYYHEEPIGSSSVLAQWDVYRKAKEGNVTVLIDGQGADEYLAGYVPIYNIYLDQIFLEKRLSYKKEHRRFTEKHEKRFHPPLKEFDDSLISRARCFARQLIGKPSVDTNIQYRTLKQHLELLTTKTTLKELLRYADRNSMAHSREVRLPFLSHKLVEFVHSLPNEYLLQDGWTKFILRNAMKDDLPKDITWRVDKIGYEPPQERWMDNSDIADIVFDQRKKYGVGKGANVSYTNSTDWRLLADYFL